MKISKVAYRGCSEYQRLTQKIGFIRSAKHAVVTVHEDGMVMITTTGNVEASEVPALIERLRKLLLKETP